jgi:hypothetical protein
MKFFGPIATVSALIPARRRKSRKPLANVAHAIRSPPPSQNSLLELVWYPTVPRNRMKIVNSCCAFS